MQAGEGRNVIGSQIRTLRAQKGLSQADMVARCGVQGLELGQPAISQIENGTRGVSDLEMILLARALRVELAELVPDKLPKWEKDKRPPNAWD